MGIKELKRNHNLNVKKCTMKGKAILIETDEGNFVIKEKYRDNNINNEKILDYLNSRSFNYYPEIVEETDDYIMTEMINEVSMPKEQKLSDMIDLTGLLHSKTTHFKEVDLDEYKELFEDISNNIAYLRSYYDDYINIASTKVFMSPSEYLLARNCTQIFSSLEYAYKELEEWYELIKEKRKQRHVVLHNNLHIDHFVRDKNPYLLSWDKAKIGIPIFDFYKLYKRHGVEYEFDELLKRYEKNYPLLEEEKKLLFILLSLPRKIDFTESEYELCTKISYLINEIYKSSMIISPYDSKYTE